MSEIQVNTINEYTSANGVTIDGLTIKDGAITAGNPITEVDSWYVNANITSNGDITSNLTRTVATGFSKLGTGMTESSGIFTFPSTGIYEVEAIIFYEVRAAAFPLVEIKVTLNDSTYGTALGIYGGERANQGGTGVTHSGTTFVDVTDTTQVKVKFTTSNLNSTNFIYGTGSRFNFKKLGGT